MVQFLPLTANDIYKFGNISLLKFFDNLALNIKEEVNTCVGPILELFKIMSKFYDTGHDIPTSYFINVMYSF